MRRSNGNKGFTLIELLFVFMAVAFIIVMMIPFINAANDYKLRSMCAENLREIGLAMYIYAQENNGQFPPDLKTLYDGKYLTNETLLDCPVHPGKGSLENPDFFYTGGLSINSPSLAPLVRDKEGNHFGRGKNILYVNGTVAQKE